MGAKTTKVTLVCNVNGKTQEFEISHAERLLRMRNNGGWQLPENSTFNFDLNNGFTSKRNKTKDS